MTALSALDVAWLNCWIQPQHTTPTAVAASCSAFNVSADRFLAIPEFLNPRTASGLADFLSTEAVFTEQFAVRTIQAHSEHRAEGAHSDHQEALVPEAEWLATPSERRFFRFSVGPGQPTRMSPGWLRYFALRSEFGHATFRAFIECVTGLHLGALSSISAHSMGAGDSLEAHSDVMQRRRLAFILYLSRQWDPAYGGRLLVTRRDGQITTIVPAFNTLVLFDVTAHKSHRVEMVMPAAGDARRLSVSGWLDDAAPNGALG